ncbi:MAG: DUF4405 domain-containing protein [Candidatus Sumerlaeota bacterium]|nr:DUF4405 domain-containing protein [Candidatus Sumerlaeota bacterium]
MRTRYLVNVLLGLTGLCQIVTGVGLATVELDLFEEAHSVVGFVMSGFVCLHVLQHWGWIRKNVLRKD